MTTTTLLMVLNTAMPTLMVAGLIATLFPLAVLLLIRRRSRRLSWGAMWLVQETLRRRAPLKLLRVLLLVVRSATLPIAAAAIVGLWLLSDGLPHDRPRLIIVDDAIGAWITGADGRCAMDDHIDTLARLEELSNDPLPRRSVVGQSAACLRCGSCSSIAAGCIRPRLADSDESGR